MSCGTMTWLMFTISGALAAFAVLWLCDEPFGTRTAEWFARLGENPKFRDAAHLPVVPWMGLVIAVGGLRWHFRELIAVPGVVMTLIVGGICAFGLAVILQSVGTGLDALIRNLNLADQFPCIELRYQMAERLTILRASRADRRRWCGAFPC